MSKQLAISASASIFAMVVFTVLSTTGGEFAPAHGPSETGTTIATAAPALDRTMPVLFDLVR